MVVLGNETKITNDWKHQESAYKLQFAIFESSEYVYLMFKNSPEPALLPNRDDLM